MSQPKPAARNDAGRPGAVRPPLSPFEAKKFDFTNIEGLSEHALETHRSLYEGYVTQTNALLPLLRGQADSADNTESTLKWDGLVRRFAFEHNGMVLHEKFFEVLRGKNNNPRSTGAFAEAVSRSFGSYDAWLTDVQRLAKTRGVGWILTMQWGHDSSVSNVWIEEHHLGVLAEATTLLSIDLWEHAYLLDFKPTERPQYLQTLFENIDWEGVDARCFQKARG